MGNAVRGNGQPKRWVIELKGQNHSGEIIASATALDRLRNNSLTRLVTGREYRPASR